MNLKNYYVYPGFVTLDCNKLILQKSTCRIIHHRFKPDEIKLDWHTISPNDPDAIEYSWLNMYKQCKYRKEFTSMLYKYREYYRTLIPKKYGKIYITDKTTGKPVTLNSCTDNLCEFDISNEILFTNQRTSLRIYDIFEEAYYHSKKPTVYNITLKSNITKSTLFSLDFNFDRPMFLYRGWLGKEECFLKMMLSPEGNTWIPAKNVFASDASLAVWHHLWDYSTSMHEFRVRLDYCNLAMLVPSNCLFELICYDGSGPDYVFDACEEKELLERLDKICNNQYDSFKIPYNLQFRFPDEKNPFYKLDLG